MSDLKSVYIFGHILFVNNAHDLIIIIIIIIIIKLP